MQQYVYRVETPDGEGPYGYGHDGRKCIDYDEYRQPSPWSDGLEDFSGDHHFGFASLDQLKSWFADHEREKLHNAGFVVSTYTAPHVRHGRKQVVFQRDKRRRKRKHLPLISI